MFLTVKEAAAYARVHYDTVAQALRLGELKGNQRVKGGRWLTTKAAIDQWLLGDLAEAA